MREHRQVEIIWARWIEADALDSITPSPTEKYHASVGLLRSASTRPLCGLAGNWKYRTYEEGSSSPKRNDLCETCLKILEANDGNME